MNNASKRKFTASLSQGRHKWCVKYDHPMILNSKTGKLGMPVRKGLGTDNRDAAQAIINDLNAILANEDLWNLAARETAERTFKYHPKAISAFYDHDRLKPAFSDPWEKRNSIRLPAASDGYSIVQLVGSFGVGKTTLIRQLLGTDPKKERFPATAKGKTTTCDLEVVCADENFSAVVSFMSRDRTREHVEECVEAAVSAATEGQSHKSIVRKFMTHAEERFRLAYILGKPVFGSVDDDDEGDEEEEDTELPVEGTITDGERQLNADKLNNWIERCESAAKDAVKSLEDENGEPAQQLSQKDKEAFLQLIEESLYENEIIQEIVDEIMESIEARFKPLHAEQLSLDSSGWPIHWQHTTEPSDRAAFLRKVSRFSSNHSAYYGKLLTPIVDGIRVRGPFKPDAWAESSEIPRMVLLDGEGLGHVNGTSASVPISTRRRFNVANAIILVDRADTRMTAAPQALLKAIASSGNTQKLAVVFTHFDQMRGDTFDNDDDRRDYIWSSLEQAIGSVDDALDDQAGASRRLRTHLQNATFFVGKLDKRISEKAKPTRIDLNKLVSFIVEAGKPEAPTEVSPVYDLAYLFPAIQGATEKYHGSWKSQMAIEHWKRVEALTRRFAKQRDDKYLNLQPVADLLELLSEKLAKFISVPKDWKPANASLEIKDAATERVAREVAQRLQVYLSKRFREDQFLAWCNAYGRSGRGSGRARSNDVLSIGADVAAIPGETKNSRLFDDVRELFREAIDAAGGSVTT